MNEFIAMLIFMGIVLLGLFGLQCMATSFDCDQYSKMTGKETKSNYGTCFIKQNNEWLSWEEYKLRNATKGNPQ